MYHQLVQSVNNYVERVVEFGKFLNKFFSNCH